MKITRHFKSFLFLFLLGLVVFFVVGCEKTKPIKLSFEETKYTVEVGKELTLAPVVVNEDKLKYVLVYSSENDSIATYKDGVVKGIVAGEVEVKVALEDDLKNFAVTTIFVEEVAEVVKFTVSFNSNGGNTIAENEIEEGKKVIKPTDPLKVGYVFKEWFKDAELKTEYDFNSVVSASITLYAKWEVIELKVTFEANGGSAVAATDVNYGEKLNEPDTPTKEGNKFVGWFYDFELTEAYDFISEVTADLTLYAKWELNTYNVSFNVDGGNLVADQNVNYGDKAEKPDDPTKDAYLFMGWFKDSEKTIIFDFDVEVIKKDTVIFAEWLEEEIDFEVTFDSNEGTVIEKAVVLSGETVFKPVDPIKEGYTFQGWHSDSNLTVEYDFNTPVVENLTIYAKWNEDVNELNYELNGGAWSWDVSEVISPKDGINSVSTLPIIFMQDIYQYLKDNDLLESANVDVALHKTTWAEFSKSYIDPYAIYNWSSNKPDGGGYVDHKGYNQFFYDTATGNDVTKEITEIIGGFFGTEPYKTKYANLASHLALMLPEKYSTLNFWGGADDKGGMAFMMDGYFYGTQGAGAGKFLSLRSVVPTTSSKFIFDGTTLNSVDTGYQALNHKISMETKLVAPSRVGFLFEGWYTNAAFIGEKVETIPAGKLPASKYYAKWKDVSVEDTLSYNFDLTVLDKSTTYVNEVTSVAVNNKVTESNFEIERLNANISASGDNSGVVIAIRKPNWDSAFIQTAFTVENLSRVEISMVNWTTDASLNLEAYLETFTISVSSDKENWTVLESFKEEFDVSLSANNIFEADVSASEGPLYVRFTAVAKSDIASTYSLRFIVQSIKLFTK